MFVEGFKTPELDAVFPPGSITDDEISSTAGITATKIPALSTLPSQTSVSTSVSGGVFNGGFENAPAFTAPQTTDATWNIGTAAGSATNDSYGWFVKKNITAFSAQYDNVPLSSMGNTSFKLVATTIGAGGYLFVDNTANNTAGIMIAGQGILLKPNTSYIFRGNTKLANVTTGLGVSYRIYTRTTAGAVVQQLTSTRTNSTSTVLHEISFTTGATETWLRVIGGFVAGASDMNDGIIAWFDDITLEEVQTSTVAVKEPTYISEVIQGVTSTTSIDQSLDGGFAASQTYTPPVAISEVAGNLQSIVPTKKNIYSIKVMPVAKGTGDWTLTFHTAANAVIASKTITNANITNGTALEFVVPNLWVTGTVHIHLTSTVADGTVKTGTDADFDTVSYIEYYAKPTEGTTLTSNGVSTVLRSDGDGILNGAVIDIDNGKYEAVFPGLSSNFPDIASIQNFANNVYSASFGDNGSAVTNTQVINGWEGRVSDILAKNTATTKNMVIKINTILPVKSLQIIATEKNANIDISLDGVNFITLESYILNTTINHNIYTSFANGNSVFFIRFGGIISTFVSIYRLGIIADLDTSSVVLPRFYPINTTLQRSINWLATGTVLSYVYRQNKYTNGSGIVMPTFELNSAADGTGASLGQIVCDFDNSGETTPSGRVMAGSTGVATTTNGLTDGQYVALSSGATSGVITYQLGGGTTTFINPTKNRLYLSSNGNAVASDRDPSLQANIQYGIRTQGLVEDVTLDRNKLRAMQNKLLKKTVRITVPVGTTTIRETYGATHLIIGVPSTSSAVTVDLDCALLTKVKQVKIVDESGAANVNNITISTLGPCKINGADTQVINTAGGSLTLYTSGTAWFIK